MKNISSGFFCFFLLQEYQAGCIVGASVGFLLKTSRAWNQKTMGQIAHDGNKTIKPGWEHILPEGKAAKAE